jgi:O-glycosyl hydrolase
MLYGGTLNEVPQYLPLYNPEEKSEFMKNIYGRRETNGSSTHTADEWSSDHLFAASYIGHAQACYDSYVGIALLL